MIRQRYWVLLLACFSLVRSQSIIMEGRELILGMEKETVLEKMKDFSGKDGFDGDQNDFWLIRDGAIIGSMGFKNDALDYVTTDWDKDIDYIDSIDLFDTIYSVMKNTFGQNYGGDIILRLKEIKEPKEDALEINLFSIDGRSVRINRNNISLGIQQVIQKL